MKIRIGVFALLFIAFGCSSSDDETCQTYQPVEMKVGETRISFSWQDLTDGQIVSDYEIQFGPAGFELGNGATTLTNRVIISSSPDTRFHIRTLNSLPFETAFDFYYRAQCGGDRGEFEGPISLTTLAFGQGCTPAAQIELIELTPTTATIAWEGFDESLWDVSWGSNDGTVGGDREVTEPIIQITDLEPGLDYLLGILTRCTGGEMDFVTSPVNADTNISFSTPEE